MQHRIYLATKKSDFFLMYYYQKLLVSNLFLKIKAIEDILTENYQNKFLTLEEIFQVIYNYNYLINYDYNRYYIFKDSGLSFYYSVQDLYYKIFQYVWHCALFPFIETNSTKYSFNYRPYRIHYDFLMELKNIFSKQINKEKVLVKISSCCLWNYRTNYWIIRNLPFIKKIINNLIIHKSNLLKDENKIYLSLVDYMLNKWNFKKSKSGCFIKECSKNYVRSYRRKLKNILKNYKNKSIYQLICIINSKIVEWKIYFKVSKFYKILSSSLDIYLNKILWTFVKRCHPRRTNTWIYNKYWKNFNGTWKFFSIDLTSGKILILMSHHLKGKFKIDYRIHNLLTIFNIYNQKKCFKINFKKSQYNFIGIYSILYNKQKGLCAHCKYLLNDKELKLVNISKLSYNKYFFSTLFLLHKNCCF
uniref:putative group II intron reverse transcriptase/maturase RoaA n=1 Tax=Euglena deses TaxID=66845 RepID=UPI0023AADEBF|nr:putative group II intron reverse transcriptase/maturase RoaA [Euglena deses]WCH63371.1 putative group II intron reverse transcriptase/maturase RoaA [Euglena deses]